MLKQTQIALSRRHVFSLVDAGTNVLSRCSPADANLLTSMVLSNATLVPFTDHHRVRSLQMSSSGGGLFDTRPTTQTESWGVCVFGAISKCHRSPCCR